MQRPAVRQHLESIGCQCIGTPPDESGPAKVAAVASPVSRAGSAAGRGRACAGLFARDNGDPRHERRRCTSKAARHHGDGMEFRRGLENITPPERYAALPRSSRACSPVLRTSNRRRLQHRATKTCLVRPRVDQCARERSVAKKLTRHEQVARGAIRPQRETVPQRMRASVRQPRAI